MKKINESLWFELLQPLLLKIANTDYGQDLLCIQKLPHRVVLINEKEVRYYLGRQGEKDFFLSDFRTGAKWGNVIRCRWSEFKAYAKKFYEKELYGGKIYLPLLKYQGMYVAGCVTDTFYPDAGDPAATVKDETIARVTAGTWTEMRGGAGNGGNSTDNPDAIGRLDGDAGSWSVMKRGIFGFATGATIPADNTITSATFSINGTAKSADIFSQSVVIDRNVPASATAFAQADFNIAGWDGVEQASNRITHANWSTTAYNEFTLNATGRGNIAQGSGNSWFGTRYSGDFDNVEPTVNTATDTVSGNMADAAGTTTDPRLVVVHSGAVTNHWLLTGV